MKFKTQSNKIVIFVRTKKDTEKVPFLVIHPALVNNTEQLNKPKASQDHKLHGSHFEIKNTVMRYKVPINF